jgi:hypothetical protein
MNKMSRRAAACLPFVCATVALAGGTGEAGERFVQKLALPGQRTAVVAEGDLEARSMGSYSVRVYSTERAQPGDDTTFFSSGVIRPRDGGVERILLADVDGSGRSSLVVVIRSAGSGGYLSADAFAIGPGAVTLRGSVSGLPANADPVAVLRSSMRHSRKD